MCHGKSAHLRVSSAWIKPKVEAETLFGYLFGALLEEEHCTAAYVMAAIAMAMIAVFSGVYLSRKSKHKRKNTILPSTINWVALTHIGNKCVDFTTFPANPTTEFSAISLSKRLCQVLPRVDLTVEFLHKMTTKARYVINHICKNWLFSRNAKAIRKQICMNNTGELYYGKRSELETFAQHYYLFVRQVFSSFSMDSTCLIYPRKAQLAIEKHEMNKLHARETAGCNDLWNPCW